MTASGPGRVLHVLTYFTPHVSGLTIHVARLARLLAARGTQVTVLAARHLPTLPAAEMQEGVRVVRPPALGTVGKGVVTPGFGAALARLLPAADVVHLHLPLLEAAWAARLAAEAGKPVVLTVHCDLVPPPGLLSRAAGAAVSWSARRAARRAAAIVTYTADYAAAVPFFAPFREKVRAILPPVSPLLVDRSVAADLRRRAGIPEGARVVGLAARWAADKGIGVLLSALEVLRAREGLGDTVLLSAGPREETRGERESERLRAVVARLGAAVAHAGTLASDEMGTFYGAIDVLAVPSVNRTESFGLVQVEAMLCAVPVVASDLPGVRTVVGSTGAGLVVPPGDPEALAGALATVLSETERFRPDRAAVALLYDPASVAAAWERLYAAVRNGGPLP